MKSYIKTGTCIWCSKSEPHVTFHHKPHIIPRSLGGRKYGCDVCDDCNAYFGGNKDKNAEYPPVTIDLAVKEIFTLIRFYISHKSNLPDHLFKSRFFIFNRKKSKLIIKPSLKYNGVFLRNFINQFKRGLFEIFLQEYHLETGNGLDDRFNAIRYYSRYNQSPIPVFLIVHDGVYLVGDKMGEPQITINKHCQDVIDEYGFYQLFLMGHTFIMPVTPKAVLRQDDYFKNIGSKSVLPVTERSGIYVVNSIDNILKPLNEVYGKK